jgi:hypothetical protein
VIAPAVVARFEGPNRRYLKVFRRRTTISTIADLMEPSGDSSANLNGHRRSSDRIPLVTASRNSCDVREIR